MVFTLHLMEHTQNVMFVLMRTCQSPFIAIVPLSLITRFAPTVIINSTSYVWLILKAVNQANVCYSTADATVMTTYILSKPYPDCQYIQTFDKRWFLCNISLFWGCIFYCDQWPVSFSVRHQLSSNTFHRYVITQTSIGQWRPVHG